MCSDGVFDAQGFDGGRMLQAKACDDSCAIVSLQPVGSEARRDIGGYDGSENAQRSKGDSD